MQFRDTPVPGVIVVEAEPVGDERGFFARVWSAEEFASRGLVTRFDHLSVSFNHRAGTLRGMHYQAPPFAETKVVRCVRGAIFDVAVDLRPQSPAFRRWTGVELSADNHRALYIPVGCAHGFQTLTEDCEMLYFDTAPYRSDAESGGKG